MKRLDLVLAIAVTGSFVAFPAFSKGRYRYYTTTLESAVVTFENGSATLSSTDKESLRLKLGESEKRGPISKIEIVAWPDKEHPSSGRLSMVDLDLADRRIEAIRQELRRKNTFRYIRGYNMGENSHWLGRFFQTTKSGLDAAFSGNENRKLKRKNIKIVKANGGPGKAVVIFKIRIKSDEKK